MDEFELKPIGSTSAARRKCLLGITIMLVEDSLSASEALRLMAVASGARLRRADRLLTAERHLALFRPNVVMVDLGLPDGSGLNLISKINRTARPRPALIAVSGGDIDEWGPAAKEAGADQLLAKPVGGIAGFQNCLLSVLPDGKERREGNIPQIFKQPITCTEAVKEDLSNARDLLMEAVSNEDAKAFAYAGQFVTSLAVMLKDQELAAQVSAMMSSEPFGSTSTGIAQKLVALIDRRRGADVQEAAIR